MVLSVRQHKIKEEKICNTLSIPRKRLIKLGDKVEITKMILNNLNKSKGSALACWPAMIIMGFR